MLINWPLIDNMEVYKFYHDLTISLLWYRVISYTWNITTTSFQFFNTRLLNCEMIMIKVMDNNIVNSLYFIELVWVIRKLRIHQDPLWLLKPPAQLPCLQLTPFSSSSSAPPIWYTVSSILISCPYSSCSFQSNY